jgi:hypothetical protein
MKHLKTFESFNFIFESAVELTDTQAMGLDAGFEMNDEAYQKLISTPEGKAYVDQMQAEIDKMNSTEVSKLKDTVKKVQAQAQAQSKVQAVKDSFSYRSRSSRSILENVKSEVEKVATQKTFKQKVGNFLQYLGGIGGTLSGIIEGSTALNSLMGTYAEGASGYADKVTTDPTAFVVAAAAGVGLGILGYLLSKKK